MNQSLTRSQRRMEKRQAIVLLCAVLAVALFSFALGVMVGRSNTPVAVVSEPAPVPVPKARPEAVVQAKPEADTVDATAPAAPAESAPATEEKLTFYDTLPKGDQALGSGINLPPKEAPPAETPVPTPQPKPEPAPTTSAPAAKPAAQAPVAAVPLPAASSSGSYVVQLASFKDTAGAGKFRQGLAGQGLPLFTEPADLGAKGIWYRVYAGPYASRDEAQAVAMKLQETERLAPLVRKR